MLVRGAESAAGIFVFHLSLRLSINENYSACGAYTRFGTYREASTLDGTIFLDQIYVLSIPYLA
jgi:hypothetical protein